MGRNCSASKYADLFEGDETWEKLGGGGGDRFAWDAASTYVRCPPYFDKLSREIPAVGPVTGMRPLAVLGDSITTDHLSPSGAIVAGSPAARFLMERGRQAGGLQLLRNAARQSRSRGARDLRKYPAP